MTHKVDKDRFKNKDALNILGCSLFSEVVKNVTIPFCNKPVRPISINAVIVRNNAHALLVCLSKRRNNIKMPPKLNAIWVNLSNKVKKPDCNQYDFTIISISNDE